MASNLLILLFCCGLSFWGELDFGNPYISLSRWRNDVPEALQTAILDGNLPRVKELVQLGISVQAQNMYWESPLYLAIQSDREDIYAFLLQHGATLYIDDIDIHLFYYFYTNLLHIEYNQEYLILTFHNK